MFSHLGQFGILNLNVSIPKAEGFEYTSHFKHGIGGKPRRETFLALVVVLLFLEYAEVKIERTTPG